MTRNVCVMCSEKEPLRCHRFLLVSRILKDYNIYHIMPDGSLLKNSNLEDTLLNMYGSISQITFFDNESEETLEEKAYREHGLKTAYMSQKVKDMIANGITEDMPDKVKIFCIGTGGKTAEEFFRLLKDNKVRRVIDIRPNRNSAKSFANYPDIAYYFKLHCITYERIEGIVPSHWNTYGYHKVRVELYVSRIHENNNILTLISEDLDGTCFLGEADDYKLCYRQVLIKELKKKNKNITVRHLR